MEKSHLESIIALKNSILNENLKTIQSVIDTSKDISDKELEFFISQISLITKGKNETHASRIY
jgi:predicted metal-dependent peptidase